MILIRTWFNRLCRPIRGFVFFIRRFPVNLAPSRRFPCLLHMGLRLVTAESWYKQQKLLEKFKRHIARPVNQPSALRRSDRDTLRRRCHVVSFGIR